MKRELEERERKVFTDLEEEFGYSLHTSLKRQIKDFTLLELGIERNDLDGDPNGQDEYIEHLERWASGFYLEGKYGLRNSADSSVRKGIKGGYAKPFQRRLRIVLFVIDSWARSLESPSSGRDNRINWKQVTAEWNEAHPDDQFEGPTSIKSLYNQAIRQWIVLLGILMHELRELAKINRGLFDKCALGVAKKYKISTYEREENIPVVSIVESIYFRFYANPESKVGYREEIIANILINHYLRTNPEFKKRAIEEIKQSREDERKMMVAKGYKGIQERSLKPIITGLWRILRKEAQNERPHNKKG